MNTLPCETCKGFCCGPVAVTEQEVKAIRKKVRSMPVKLKASLQNQTRFPGTCIFYDLDNNRCGIYSARPEACKKFGHHANMACPFAPEAATRPNWYSEEEPIGLLSVDFTWKDFK